MIINLPNTLTIMRLFLIPVFIYAALVAEPSLRWIAAFAFGIAAATDWLDGYIARRFNQVTEFGKIFDPLVDRVLIVTALIVLYIMISDIVPLWPIAIVVGRDLMMVIGWLYFSHIGKRIRVSAEGKTATAVLMLSVFILLLRPALPSDTMTSAIMLIGILLFYFGVILSLVSGLKYIRLGVTILRSNQPKR